MKCKSNAMGETLAKYGGLCLKCYKEDRMVARLKRFCIAWLASTMISCLICKFHFEMSWGSSVICMLVSSFAIGVVAEFIWESKYENNGTVNK